MWQIFIASSLTSRKRPPRAGICIDIITCLESHKHPKTLCSFKVRQKGKHWLFTAMQHYSAYYKDVALHAAQCVLNKNSNTHLKWLREYFPSYLTIASLTMFEVIPSLILHKDVCFILPFIQTGRILWDLGTAYITKSSLRHQIWEGQSLWLIVS